MSNGNYPQSAETVDHEFVRNTCPFLLGVLTILCKDAGTTLEDISDCLDEHKGQDTIDEVTDEQEAAIRLAYEQLQTKFKEYTGLGLYIHYHSAEDKGDEVDGTFWEVDGVYTYSLAGEKYKDKITTKGWTVFG